MLKKSISSINYLKNNLNQTTIHKYKKVSYFGVDLIFLPKKNFANTSLSIDIGQLGKKLCGKDRPGHFSGVALIILKFLNLIQPHFLILGQKDYQQILVIKKLIKDFFFKTKVIGPGQNLLYNLKKFLLK